MKRFLTIVQYVFAAVSLLAITVYVFRKFPVDQSKLSELRWGYLIFLLFLAVLDLWLRAFRLRQVASLLKEKITVFKTFQVASLGDFYSSITPSRMAGEPSRWYYLQKFNIPKVKAASIIGIENTIDLVYLICSISLILYFSQTQYDQLQDRLSGLIKVFFTVFCIILFLMVFSKKLTYSFLVGVQRKFKKINLAKKYIQARAYFLNILNYGKLRFFAYVGITFLWWFNRFSILWLIALMLGYSLLPADVYIPQFLMFNSLHLTPLPISGGSFEAAFVLIYKSKIPIEDMAVSLFLWRFFTYYIYMINGAGVLLIRSLKSKQLKDT
ncbi:MAG TPA: lysylphosphatidylglycerol synthase transmembrane domain-containing protein [Oligoflexia bacterium]|nr:lysylphosphatidylglycerol synthase transmembrane domain-containing protein [Oligoflexia bacterium]HMR24457.1 lysylphosphatidylglycerol synthase transmembrane domain-containing protein [Oligoflexia bacterium]